MSCDSKTATAAPDRRRLLLPITALILTALAGCASPAPPPVRSKPAPATQETPAPSEPEPAPASTPTPQPEEPKHGEPKHGEVIVLDPGGEGEDSTRTLVEAARAERERRAHAAPSSIVITDKNLKQHASSGQLTVATPSRKPGTAEADPEPVRDEQYWRSRALEIRLRWRHAADDVKELETSANGWRRSFYAEKDPNVRNVRIKPEWDRALDRLEEARAEVEASKQELAELLEEGRTAGALPGWLREGIDQEPQEEPEPSNTHKVIEPPTVDSKDGKGA